MSIDYKKLHEEAHKDGKDTLDIYDVSAGHPVAEAELSDLQAQLRTAEIALLCAQERAAKAEKSLAEIEAAAIERFLAAVKNEDWEDDDLQEVGSDFVMYIRQQAKQWDGEGLPPVGAMVDIEGHGLVYGDGESGEVLGHIEGTAIVRMSYGLGCFAARVLKPLKSHRDKCIEAAEEEARREAEKSQQAQVDFTREELGTEQPAGIGDDGTPAPEAVPERLTQIISDLDYAAYNLCKSPEPKNIKQLVESTCPERTLYIAIRNLRALASRPNPKKQESDMPKVKVTTVTVSHVWGDDSETKYSIRKGYSDDDLGPYVSLEQENDTIWLRPESWPEIRDQIDAMFDEIEREQQ